MKNAKCLIVYTPKQINRIFPIFFIGQINFQRNTGCARIYSKITVHHL